ncbi:hypothetical protein [Promicromonospora soli]
MSQPTSPPPPVFAPDAALSFTVQGNIMTSNLIAPTLTIDGHLAPVPISGTRQIPIMSGRHHLQVHSQWMRRYGHAAIDIDVVPGQNLEVFYAPPYHQFSNDGSMGLTPQARKGRGLIIGLWVFVGLVILLPAVAVVAVLVGE